VSKKNDSCSRRQFIKTAGIAGLASLVSASGASAAVDSNKKNKKSVLPLIPSRPLGRTGASVPILTLGGVFDILNGQIVLKKSYEWGVTCWDTAHSYMGGRSEMGIGKYLAKNPSRRKELFIITKTSKAKNVAEMESLLQSSLERMKTSYVDAALIHDMAGPDQLTSEVRKWAENSKKRGTIRFFGFSAHRDMAQKLMAASKLNWIDVILTSYNFRLMQDKKMDEAVEACYQAGIGLIAMKTQAKKQKPKGEKDDKLFEHFLKRDFNEYQAKLKVVWEDKRFATICSGMPSIATLVQNVAAALDKTRLSQRDREVLRQYACATSAEYCTGCAEICLRVVPEMPYVSDVMRYLMYYNSYGEDEHARQLFAALPSSAKARMHAIDYSRAEAACPQRLPINSLIAEALKKLV
jgi:hypothetical protein